MNIRKQPKNILPVKTSCRINIPLRSPKTDSSPIISDVWAGVVYF